MTSERVSAAALRARAVASHTDALVLRHDDRLVAEWYSARGTELFDAMSCTKSVVALAVGCLIGDGAISSVDQPVHEAIPEWRQGNKRFVTLRHLLSHTSGLQNVPDTAVEIYPSPDVVQLALAAELETAPGERFAYNNKAVNLIGGIVERVSGLRLDEYIRRSVFEPLEITEFEWGADAAGHRYAMGGLRLRAQDLAKIGQLVLDEGMWQGSQIVDPAWIRTMLEQGQPFEPRCGLLWWRMGEYEQFTIDGAMVEALAAGGRARLAARLRPLIGVVFESREAYFAALDGLLGAEQAAEIKENEVTKRMGFVLSRKSIGNVVGYRAQGWLGQHLIVLPRTRLVGVRMIHPSPRYNPRTDGFEDFGEMLRGLL